jgi:glycosyltransferase involved in cell wall biosynthesis
MVSEHASPLATLGGVDAGGQNVHVSALARELGRRGVEVVVHTRRDDPALPRRVPLAPGVFVDHVDAGPAQVISKDSLLPYMDDFAEGLARLWREDPPDLAHGHFWMSGRAALAAAAPLGIPVAQTFHALGIVKRRHQGAKDTSPPSRLGEEERLIGSVDHIVATCSDEVFELVRLGADRKRITVVPCGVDTEAFTPDGEVERRSARPRVVVLTRLVERKGVGDMVAALPALPGVELVVAGGGESASIAEDPEGRRLAALARRLGVLDRIDLRGRIKREEVAPLLRSADVVVCAPWYEPFGIVPLEAMACGAPVVATAVGGLVDTVVDGVTGLHVPPRDPPALARAVGRLLGDADLRARLGGAGVERVRTRYTWERVASSTLSVYRKLVAAPAEERERAWR